MHKHKYPGGSKPPPYMYFLRWEVTKQAVPIAVSGKGSDWSLVVVPRVEMQPMEMR